MGPVEPVEMLEPRRLFATQTLGPDGVLDIVLNPGADRVRILPHPDSSKIDVIVRREQFRQFEGVTAVRIDGGTGADTMYLATGLSIPATLIGGAGRDVLIGGAANDTIDGGVGNDIISGAGGDDVLTGGLHNDNIAGGDGNDTIDGGAGADRIDGGAGDDVIDGGAGRDRIDGADGADRMVGGGARDILSGGAGVDTFSQIDRDREIRDLATDDVRTGA